MKLLASSLTEKGAQTALPMATGAAVGMASGSAPSRNPKLWVCEDSLALHRLPEGTWLAAVADAHFGGSSSEHVINGLLAAYASSEGSIPERLIATLRALDATLHVHRDDHSETTVLLVHLDGSRLHWASIGDSLLLICGHAKATHINRHPLCALPFLGRTPWAGLAGIVADQGSLELHPDEVALLATDGIETETSGLVQEDVAEILRQPGRLVDRVAALLSAADRIEQGGGRDNLALIALTPCSPPGV